MRGIGGAASPWWWGVAWGMWDLPNGMVGEWLGCVRQAGLPVWPVALAVLSYNCMCARSCMRVHVSELFDC